MNPERSDSNLSSDRRLRVVLAHDWLVGYRGGEAVLDQIARCVNEHVGEIIAVFTLFSDHCTITPRLDALPRQSSILNPLPASKRLRRWLLPAYCLGVADLSHKLAKLHLGPRGPIDLLISTSSAAIHGLQPPPNVPHLCYCHTPPRYLWTQTNQYNRGLMGVGLRMLGPLLRRVDLKASSRVSSFFANSNHTKDQIERIYRRPAITIYPPVQTEFFTLPPLPPSRSKSASTSDAFTQDYLLCVSALEPYKRIDLAIETALKLGQPLLIVGSGSMLHRLQAQAADSPLIRFAGKKIGEELRSIYQNARALLFPQIEDFGIVAVEAQACGTPVVALAKGGALETVIDNITGTLVQEQTAGSLADGVHRCPTKPQCSQACRSNAERFAESAFQSEFLKVLQTSLKIDHLQERRSAHS